MTEKKLKKLVGEDILKLKFLLKTRIATFNVIQKKEQKEIDHFKDTLKAVKSVENHLRRELKLIDSLRKSANRDHKIKRWDAIRKVLKKELEDFHNDIVSNGNFVQSCSRLNQGLDHFQRVLKNAKRKAIKCEELKIIRQFGRNR